MLELCSDFNNDVLALLALADDEVLEWRLFDLPALPTWCSDRLALLGDAAHPLLPYAAQGGAQAIEDAVTLSVLLQKGTPPGDVPERLKLYFDARHERAEYVQQFARTQGAARPGQKEVPDDGAWHEFFKKIFSHDAWGHAEEVLKHSKS
ncbi:hypothetical protein LTS18_002220 [Coniosporium uncinatum]|uniref:Uncharacterized protein n=1 Tax=Coniosporium uncinatum TaxID=93489 RepID=A0ACC3CSK4_9PEZI|nr:hypothetical protein LTS18_002220 [Coniosporium uncinatum]